MKRLSIFEAEVGETIEKYYGAKSYTVEEIRSELKSMIDEIKLLEEQYPDNVKSNNKITDDTIHVGLTIKVKIKENLRMDFSDENYIQQNFRLQFDANKNSKQKFCMLVADQILDYMSGWFTIVRANRKVSELWLSQHQYSNLKATDLEYVRSEFEKVKSQLK